MKRLMIATALTATLSTAGFAATPAQETQIEIFLPNVDASTLSDTQVATAMSIINGSDSRGAKLAKLESIVAGTEYTPMPAMLSATEEAALQEVAPDVNLAEKTQAEVNAALAVLNSAEGSDGEAKARAILMDDGMAMGTGNSATQGEMFILEQYAPEVDVAALTEPQLNAALAVVYGTDSAGEIRSKLQALFN